VRFAGEAEEICVVEGIESGLSVMQATGRPTWAALSTSGMIGLVLPASVCSVIIAADGDPSGEAAAQAAAQRWEKESRSVRIARPPAGLDFNDLLRRGRA
jgi:DNA primase